MRLISVLTAAALVPKFALPGGGEIPIEINSLSTRNLGLKVGLLQLNHSSTNSLVAAFAELAKSAVLRIFGNRLKATRACKDQGNWSAYRGFVDEVDDV